MEEREAQKRGWLKEEEEVFMGGENLAVGSKSRQSSTVSPALPDFRPDSPAVSKKLPSSVVWCTAGFFWPGARFLGLESGPTGPGTELSARKNINTKMVITFASDSVFDELGLVGITTTRSKTSS
jgi:hypothetical protein